MLSVVSRQHGNNNRTITGQGSAVATIFTKPRMLYVCEVILEYDAYDVLLKCVLPANIKRLCWALQVVEWGDVLVYTNDVLQSLHSIAYKCIRPDMSRNAV